MNQKLNILVLGSGGREHAICWKLSQSPQAGNLYVAPGNPGMQSIATCVALNPLDGNAVAAWCQSNAIDLVVIGPEAPLAEGVADLLRERGLPVVGPGKDGAVLESSKDWSKRFMARHSIPTAAYRSFEANQLADAKRYVSAHSLPVVVKASGLAAGKGVVICATHDEAVACVEDMLGGNAFGEAGDTIVVEQFLTGIEVSVFVLTDGKRYVVLPEAKDYKRIGEGDTGPNTGGMGAVSPVAFADETFMQKVDAKIIRPTIHGLAAEKIDYRGFIFFGLINVGGDPYVIEYNARMGDPETEAVMPRIQGDLLPVLWQVAQGDLQTETLDADRQYAVTVVLVSGGYPGAYPKNKVISLGDTRAALLFHAGTAASADGALVTAGGRVFAVTGRGDDLYAARDAAYAAASQVQFEGMNFRKDIGLDLASQ